MMALVETTNIEILQPSQAPEVVSAPDLKLSLPYIETPLAKSVILSQKFGANIWLKFEQAQPSGSFKSRGLGWLIYKTIQENPGIEYHFFCASGGNAGYAAACAAQQYGQKCTICLPATSDPLMVARIESTGARVVCAGTTIAESDQYINDQLLNQARAKGETPFYCHPYDLPLVWQGNSSIADELVAQTSRAGFKPNAVVCSVGGGGLYAGIVEGLQRYNYSQVEMVAVETDGCNTLAQSIEQRRQVQHERPNTVCTSLANRNVCTKAIEYALEVQPTHSIVVRDRDAVEACVEFAAQHKILVEPACGAALAPFYTHQFPLHLLTPESNIVVVVCGGSNITYRKLEQHCRDLGVEFLC